MSDCRLPTPSSLGSIEAKSSGKFCSLKFTLCAPTTEARATRLVSALGLLFVLICQSPRTKNPDPLVVRGGLVSEGGLVSVGVGVVSSGGVVEVEVERMGEAAVAMAQVEGGDDEGLEGEDEMTGELEEVIVEAPRSKDSEDDVRDSGALLVMEGRSGG